MLQDEGANLTLDFYMKVVSVGELIALLREEFLVSSSVVRHDKRRTNGDEVDFVLIGSRALQEYFHDQYSRLDDLDETIYRNHLIMKRSRKRFVSDDRDWDLICLNIESLIQTLESSGNHSIREVRINYFEKVENFTMGNLLSDDFERINEIVPKKWKEISFCLQLNCGSIIEIEYCDDNQQYLKQYLKTFEKLEHLTVPFFKKAFLSPLNLLEVIKKSHLSQNIELEKWKTHFIDLSLIRLMKKSEDLYVNLPFELAIDNQNPLDCLYYERLIKLIALISKLNGKDKGELLGEIANKMNSYIFTKSYPFNNTKDMLCKEIIPSSLKLLKDVFKANPIKRRLKSTDDIDYFPESLDYVSQQVCAFILPRFNTWLDVDNIDEQILLAFQRICLNNHDNKIFTYMIDNGMEISGKVHSILNQPSILMKFFKDQEIEFKLISPSHRAKLDPSSLEGVHAHKMYLNSDIALKILSFISGKELCYMSMLNKEWSTLLSGDLVWKYIYSTRHGPNEEYNSRIGDWKFITVLDNQLLPLPAMDQLTKITNLFKFHFSNNPYEFHRFITNIFSNTIVINQSTSHENAYDKLNATLFIKWPNNEATKLDFSLTYDNDNEFRGCSKSNYVPPALYFQLSNANFTFGGTSLFQCNLAEKASYVIGNYFGTEMNGKMATCFLICLISLAFGEEWLNKIHK